MSKHIPQDLEAEEALLGACMLSPRAIEVAAEQGVSRDTFMRLSHRDIWDAIVALAEVGEVDELTVTRWLDDHGKAKGAGGFVGISTLVERCPAVSNAKSYAVAVRSSWVRREAVTAGEAVAALGYEGEQVGELRDRALALVDGLADRIRGVRRASVTTLADQAGVFYNEMDERYQRGGGIAGIPTGLRALDARWGGLQPGRLYVIAGRPGMGKSALGMGMVEAAAFGSGVESLCFNFEMMPSEQGGRAIARHGWLNLHRLSNVRPSDSDFAAAYDTQCRIMEGAKLVAIDEASELTSAEVRDRTREYARALEKDGRKLGVVMIDYLQKVKPSSEGEKEYQTITRAAGTFKSLALELGVPVIALAQLNRGSERRDAKEPSMADLRGSGAIEQDADIVLLLHRPEYYGDQSPEWRGRAMVATAKNRTGPDGVDDLGWEGEHVRYLDWCGPKFVAGGGMAGVA